MITFKPRLHIIEVHNNHQHIGDIIYHQAGYPEFSANSMGNLSANHLEHIQKYVAHLPLKNEPMDEDAVVSFLHAQALCSEPEEWYKRTALAMYRTGRYHFIGSHKNIRLVRFWLNTPARIGELPGGAGLFETGECILLHLLLGSDPNQCLHDHPWDFTEHVLSGEYIDHRPPINWDLKEFPNHLGPTWNADHIHRYAGDYVRHQAEHLHSVSAVGVGTWTLVKTGPTRREWGFHPPGEKWQNWRDYKEATK